MSDGVAEFVAGSVAWLRVADREAEGVDIHCKCHLRKWIWKLSDWFGRGVRSGGGLGNRRVIMPVDWGRTFVRFRG